MDLQSILTVSQLADLLGVHQDTIYTMVRQKQIPHFRIRSRIFFRVESINAWMQEQERSNTQVV